MNTILVHIAIGAAAVNALQLENEASSQFANNWLDIQQPEQLALADLGVTGTHVDCNEEAFACVRSGEHACMCGDIEHPLIIDGESVRVGFKQFSEREIAQLKTLREGQTVSTYEIFESLD